MTTSWEVRRSPLEKYGAEAIEIKFGQAAKGTQPVIRVPDLETALVKQQQGNLVHPDPSDPSVQKACHDGVCPNFYTYGRLPLWTEKTLLAHIEMLRDMGAKNIYFKMAGYDRADIERVIRMACEAQVDMVTFDGAGGRFGIQPFEDDERVVIAHGLPGRCGRSASVSRLKSEGFTLPAMVMTGGFASEDQVFKGLAYGDWPYSRDWLVPGFHGCRHDRPKRSASGSGTETCRKDSSPTVQRSKKYFATFPILRARVRRQGRMPFPQGPSGFSPISTKSHLG